MTGLYDLAGASHAAFELLRIAHHDTLDGPELDRELRRWTHPACWNPGMQAPLLYIVLREQVAAWYEHDTDPAPMRPEQHEAVRRDLDAEVLGALFPLLYGQLPCDGCVDRHLEVDQIRPAGDCPVGWHRSPLRPVRTAA